MAKVICTKDGCPNKDIEIELDTTAPITCGPCGSQL